MGMLKMNSGRYWILVEIPFAILFPLWKFWISHQALCGARAKMHIVRFGWKFGFDSKSEL